jgi:hypothetical protein
MNPEAEIMENPTINKSFSALKFLLSTSSLDQYTPLVYPHYTTSNTTSLSSILSSNPDYCYYKDQSNTVTTMSCIQDNQALPCVCNDESCDNEYQNARNVLIFVEEAYKIIMNLKNASLQPGYKFRIFAAPYSCQQSYRAIEVVQKNIQ